MRETHCWIELNSRALTGNIEILRNIVGHNKLALVLKSNAYGHGLSEIYQIIKINPPSWICVNYVNEAVRLRNFGFQGRLLVVGPCFPNEFLAAFEHSIDISISHPELLDAWLNVDNQANIHIKINTGLNRLGFEPNDQLSLTEKLIDHKEKVKGVYTHFANVEDVTNQHFASMQSDALMSSRDLWKSAGFSPLFHASASASSILIPENHLDLCRIGISLYGHWASELTRLSYFSQEKSEIGLKAVLSWKTRIAGLRTLSGGEYVGYGCAFRASGKMKIAVISVGYFEGYRRIIANNNGYVLIRGKRCRVLGRICMNMTIVDVSHLSVVNFADDVTLIGQDQDETITAENISQWAQTINYEFLSCLNPGIPRIIVGED